MSAQRVLSCLNPGGASFSLIYVCASSCPSCVHARGLSGVSASCVLCSSSEGGGGGGAGVEGDGALGFGDHGVWRVSTDEAPAGNVGPQRQVFSTVLYRYRYRTRTRFYNFITRVPGTHIYHK